MDPENDATNQVAAEDVHVTAEAGVETEDQTQLDQQDGEQDPENEGNQQPAEEEEFDEVEHEGKTYKVPKALKPALMMNADYTRKTQEVAEQRRALENERQALVQQAQADQETRKEVARYEQVEERLSALKAERPKHLETIAELRDTDWDAWAASNPTEARKDWDRFQAARKAIEDYPVDLASLENDRDTLKSSLQAKERERLSTAQREHAKRLEEAHAELARDLKDDWSPEGQRKIMEFGQTMGFSAEELSSITDPRAIKVLHAALKASRQAQTAAARATLAAQQTAKPVPQVGGSAPAGKDPSRMSTEEWMRHRSQQVSRKGR